MNAQDVKEYIINNDKIEFILSELGCHHVKSHDNIRYYTCGFPDGDNAKAMSIYTDNLLVDAYSRDIVDKYGNSDIISLVCYIKDIYFSHAIKWLCDTMGLDVYADNDEELPMSLQLIQLLKGMSEATDEEKGDKLKPVNEKVLAYYYPLVNDKFLSDGVDYATQREFEIGYDLDSQRYTIPIRDELGTLVGVKGRAQTNCKNTEKYIYLEPCAKTKILYGLYKTMDCIKESNQVIVVESEKSVLVLYSQGVMNVVAIGGHKLSKAQAEKLTRLGIKEVVLCYDEDVHRTSSGKIDKQGYLKEAEKFIKQMRVSAMVDVHGLLLSKNQSPVDDMSKFELLYNERKVLQNGG